MYLPLTVVQEPEKGTTHRTANIKLTQNRTGLNRLLRVLAVKTYWLLFSRSWFLSWEHQLTTWWLW